MQTMNTSLPDSMKQFVDEQVGVRHYSSVSQYIRELVRADQKRRATEQLEEVLLEALRSRDPSDVTPNIWAQIRQEIRARAQARESAKR